MLQFIIFGKCLLIWNKNTLGCINFSRQGGRRGSLENLPRPLFRNCLPGMEPAREYPGLWQVGWTWWVESGMQEFFEPLWSLLIDLFECSCDQNIRLWSVVSDWQKSLPIQGHGWLRYWFSFWLSHIDYPNIIELIILCILPYWHKEVFLWSVSNFNFSLKIGGEVYKDFGGWVTGLHWF